MARRAMTLPNHHYPQIWFLLITIALFGVYVAWDLRLLSTMFALDQSYVTSLIIALVVIASCHAAWHIFLFSRRIKAANQILDHSPENGNQDNRFQGHGFQLTDDEFIDSYIAEIDNGAIATSPEDDSILEIYADQLRSPVDLGWFLVDLAVRLGLLGTIVGFILIFTSLSDTTIDGSNGLKDLLVTMSGGMGTALFTTLGGLVGATLLSFQYLILGREAEQLVGHLVRIRARHSTQKTS